MDARTTAVKGEESSMLFSTGMCSLLLQQSLHTTSFLGPAYPQPRGSLLTVPNEIIEEIADNIRYDGMGEGWKSAYMLDNCTEFSYTRFDLSSFSKVCASVRRPAERRLYRDIHVHFAGWNATHNLFSHEWRGGCLRLLVRTLKSRIDLRGCVRSVQMDWYNDEMCCLEPEHYTPITDVLRWFFSHCTSVKTLLMIESPSNMFSELVPLSNVVTLATNGRPTDTLYNIVKAFPMLQDLYLTGVLIHAPPNDGFHHGIKRLYLEGDSPPMTNLTPYVFWVLEVCADIVEELRLDSSRYMTGYTNEDRFHPIPLSLSPLAGTNLRSLRLDGNQYNFLAHPDSCLAHVIQHLPSLHHLHMSRCLTLHATAFSTLPHTLRSLSISAYGMPVTDRGSRNAFVITLGKCLAEAAGLIDTVTIHGAEGWDIQRELGDLSPLRRVCNDLNIPFHFNLHSDNYRLLDELEIRILCKSMLNAI
jgi:hypothetical protein